MFFFGGAVDRWRRLIDVWPFADGGSLTPSLLYQSPTMPSAGVCGGEGVPQWLSWRCGMPCKRAQMVLRVCSATLVPFPISTARVRVGVDPKAGLGPSVQKCGTFSSCPVTMVPLRRCVGDRTRRTGRRTVASAGVPVACHPVEPPSHLCALRAAISHSKQPPVSTESGMRNPRRLPPTDFGVPSGSGCFSVVSRHWEGPCRLQYEQLKSNFCFPKSLSTFIHSFCGGLYPCLGKSAKVHRNPRKVGPGLGAPL